MKWTPELDAEEEQQYRTGYISDQTAYMRMQTQIEQREHLIDKEFFEEFKPYILYQDKFACLSNSPETQVKIDRIRRLKIALMEEAGLTRDTILCAIDGVGDYQSFRGTKGFFQEAQITERHEIKQSQEEKKKLGVLSGLVRRKTPEEQQEVVR